jgi:5-deoxy-glucuronate isomerase
MSTWQRPDQNERGNLQYMSTCHGRDYRQGRGTHNTKGARSLLPTPLLSGSPSVAMADVTLDSKQLIFSGTASKRGRAVAVSPKNSSLKHLCYGRIRLDAQLTEAVFNTEDRETALMCMKGACRIAVGGTPYDLDTYDAIYIPRGSAVEVTTASEVDLVECAADVEGEYPLQVVRYDDVKKDPALKFTAGGPATSRDLNIIIGKNVNAGRILAGFTRSHPGHWTSWPPHEHT